MHPFPSKRVTVADTRAFIRPCGPHPPCNALGSTARRRLILPLVERCTDVLIDWCSDSADGYKHDVRMLNMYLKRIELDRSRALEVFSFLESREMFQEMTVCWRVGGQVIRCMHLAVCMICPD